MLEWLFKSNRSVVEICPMSPHGSAHDEELLDKTVFPSPYEQMSPDTRRSVEFTLCFTGFRSHDFTKKAVFVFKCKWCGRIRKDIEIS